MELQSFIKNCTCGGPNCVTTPRCLLELSLLIERQAKGQQKQPETNILSH
jgi:hypothetical protein